MKVTDELGTPHNNVNVMEYATIFNISELPLRFTIWEGISPLFFVGEGDLRIGGGGGGGGEQVKKNQILILKNNSDFEKQTLTKLLKKQW